MLVGRDAERAHVARALNGGPPLLLVGDAGTGKSALLDDAARAATGPVLRVTGRGPDRGAAFAGLRALLGVGPGAPDAPPALAGALAAALGGPVGELGDPLAVAVAVLGVLAARAPVGLLVDDVQDLDEDTWAVLSVVGAHGHARGVGLVAASRPGSIRAGPGWDVVELQPLPPGAARELLAQAGVVAPPIVTRVMELAVGNPLALVLLPDLVAGGEMAGMLPAPDRLLADCFSARLDGLTPGARRALALAAADPERRLTTWWSACRGEGIDDVDRDAATGPGLLATDVDEVVFAHPLVAAVAYHQQAPEGRRRLHETLATVTSGDASVWHRAAAATAPDDELASALDAVADDARRRRAPARAAAAAARAAAFSGAADPAALRLLAGGVDALTAGQAVLAADLAARARRRADSVAVQAAADHLAGVIEVWHGDTGRGGRRLAAAARGVADQLPAQAAAMLADASVAATSAGDCRGALVDARAAEALLADGVADPAVRVQVGAALAWALTLTGDVVGAQEHNELITPLLVEVDPISPAAQTIAVALNVRSATGELVRARSEASALAEAAEAAGAWSGVGFPLVVAAEAALRLGEWDDLGPVYERAISRMTDAGQAAPRGMAHASRARWWAALGEADRCRDDVAAARRIAADHGVRSLESYALAALGLLALTEEDVDAAADLFSTLAARLDQDGQRHPTLVPWVVELAETELRRGRPDRARSLVDEVEGWASGPAAAALLRRAAVVVDDDPLPALELVEDEGPAVHGTFEWARCLLVGGERLRRSRRPAGARRPLTRALGAFDRLGAGPWSRRAASELRAASGGSPGRPLPGALTAQQQRIVDAVAAGARNKEVAAALFVSEKTVEYHLSRIYRQLGLRTRTDLVNWARGADRGSP